MTGTWVRMERARLSLLQRTLAERAGMSPPDLCRYERGYKPIPPELAARIRAALRELAERPPTRPLTPAVGALREAILSMQALGAGAK